MGIDAVASTDETHERAVLLDVERDSAQYGSTTQLTNGGADSILYRLLPFNVFILSQGENPWYRSQRLQKE